jgi:hypothetical protein
MAISLPLDEMSVEEKIRAMEALWDDLCRRADGVVSPPWHGEVLADREAAARSGEDRFEDWDAAKRRIDSELR